MCGEAWYKYRKNLGVGSRTYDTRDSSIEPLQFFIGAFECYCRGLIRILMQLQIGDSHGQLETYHT
jgi:hypothetical protein